MSFANPASDASANAAEYVRRLLELLGERDPFEVQEGMVAALRMEVAGLSHEELTRPEAPGKWSVLEVVRHLADTEIVYGYRMRLILAEDSPAIPGYDQDAWAQNLRYREADLEGSLRELEVLRAGNLALLRTLDEATGSARATTASGARRACGSSSASSPPTTSSTDARSGGSRQPTASAEGLGVAAAGPPWNTHCSSRGRTAAHAAVQASGSHHGRTHS